MPTHIVAVGGIVENEQDMNVEIFIFDYNDEWPK